MYLFQYLTCLHYNIFELNNKAIILENKNPQNNLVTILNYLLNNESNINDMNKILFLKCFILKISSNLRFVFDTHKEIENILKSEDKNNDFQKKYRPLDSNIYHDMNHKRKRHDIIVVGSLIDKAQKLGGLTRT